MYKEENIARPRALRGGMFEQRMVNLLAGDQLIHQLLILLI